MLINRTGTFRGRALESAVSLTKNGFPQYVLKCQATEYYNADDGSWVPWLDVDENETTAFLTLFDGTGQPIFHVDSIMETFGWDGQKLSGLDALDISAKEFQFTVEEHIYNDQSRLQVARIAPYDAVPGSSIRRVDASELKSLDVKFGAALLKKAGGKKPAAAPAKKSDKPAPPKTAAPPKRTPPKPAETPAATDVIEYADAGKAWEAVVAVRAKDVTDDQLAKAWGAACYEVAGDTDDDAITPAQWGAIVAKVQAECAVF